MIDISKIIIDGRKINEYLLKYRLENDKSKFLNNAGYYSENSDVLIEDILNIVMNNPPIYQSTNKYGTLYKILGKLKSPKGKFLDVVTIWLQNNSSNITNFVTLYPKKSGK